MVFNMRQLMVVHRAGVEPTWPITVDPTVINDGTVQWITVPIDDRIPSVLGTLEDGTPAMFMDKGIYPERDNPSAKIES